MDSLEIVYPFFTMGTDESLLGPSYKFSVRHLLAKNRDWEVHSNERSIQLAFGMEVDSDLSCSVEVDELGEKLSDSDLRKLIGEKCFFAQDQALIVIRELALMRANRECPEFLFDRPRNLIMFVELPHEVVTVRISWFQDPRALHFAAFRFSADAEPWLWNKGDFVLMNQN